MSIPENQPKTKSESHLRLRRNILIELYRFFKQYPYGAMELGNLEQLCNTSAEELNWNLVYLEKCGLLELDKSPDCSPFVACSVWITAEGIDLVENTSGFNRRFPTA
ncbi:MAG: hypothetical protein JRH18_11310 [Deltaproteobacteria bacterium]|nr:hypothetical protein [Deltaproteobacteria bacterium]MBW1961817.1 hypothetical protein [Deltaproteobacteria bacterium]MBW1994091.1 hypothetical protein [Deltaproteobacteria bacterium]MBW2152245.1 hypothetical protein [Deltaproteobacteria bacterium]